MENFETQARRLHVLIRAANEIGSKADVLESLTEYACLLVETDHTTEAANLLAVIMNHPDVPFEIYDRADDLWTDLEGRLCPRVIEDARTQAHYMTLRGAIDEAFAHLDG